MSAMLPCQLTCAAYHSGCHKNCEYWRLFQEEQKAQRAAKKRYLQYYGPRCAQTVQQLLNIQAKRPVW